MCVYSLANVSASRLVMLYEQSGENLENYDFLINCSLASKVLQQKTGTNLICAKHI